MISQHKKLKCAGSCRTNCLREGTEGRQFGDLPQIFLNQQPQKSATPMSGFVCEPKSSFSTQTNCTECTLGGFDFSAFHQIFPSSSCHVFQNSRIENDFLSFGFQRQSQDSEISRMRENRANCYRHNNTGGSRLI